LSTDTTIGARDHARAQAGTTTEAMPWVPAARYPQPPDAIDPESLVWAETIAGGGGTSKLLARGTTLRLRDLHGDACAHLLLYNADQPWERLNVADTVKVPWQAYMGPGHPLLSDQGRILAMIVGDDSGRHDTFAGTTTLASNRAKYGAGEPESATPAGREILKALGAKHDLTPRDIPPSISFFKGIRAQHDGSLLFTGSAGADRSVTIRCELPVVVLIANTPHPADPRPEFHCTTLEVLAWRGSPTTPEDPLWSSTPECERAFLNTADYLQARGIA
jgi:urea carboxylase-associated protein 2